MNNLINSFGPALLWTVLFAICYTLPMYFVIQFATRERKDRRIVFVVCLVTTWLIGLLVALVLPKLSDEDFAKINPPKKVNSDAGEGWSDLAIIMTGIGACTGIALLFVGWLAMI